MRIGVHGWEMGRDNDLDTMIAVCAESGMASFEIMEDEAFKSSVPLETPPDERAAIRKKFKDAGVEIAALSINCPYDSMDPAESRANIEKTKEYVRLAADIGAPRLRCLGDRLHEDEGEEKAVTIERVASALREVCEYADDFDVDCPIEMHNQFSPWENSLAVVEKADHPRCYLVHNGTPQNTPPEAWDEVWGKIKPYIRHVHVHDILSDRFPHKRFFHTLRDSGYEGLVSLELKPSGDMVRVLQLTKGLIEEWLAE